MYEEHTTKRHGSRVENTLIKATTTYPKPDKPSSFISIVLNEIFIYHMKYIILHTRI